MIEGMPWQAWIGVAGTGWMLVALFISLIFRGRWFPKSAMDERAAENRALREENKHLLEQNGILLKSALPLANSVMEELSRAANEVRQG